MPNRKPLRALFVLAALVMAVPAQPAPAARESYPSFQIRRNPGGEGEFVGWTRNGPFDWSARPADPASPRYLKLEFGPQPVDPRKAFDAALKRAGVASASHVATREIETYAVLSRPKAKGWATAGSTVIAGVPMSLFAVTGMGKKSGLYATELYLMPGSDYRRWGGVMKMLYAVGVTEHLQGLPANFTDQVRNATPAEQALVFASLVDITTMRVFGEMVQAQNGLMQTLQGVGKDIETRTHCQGIKGCSFIPGAAPGQGRYSIGR
ncbi:hypothetical protein L6Q21_14405 [Sandaracinobacter sp. RS1-74]|uniref:hypothetical protein n=1 Tax=Sandaracinobacteroides sayramensis TaxID=2913411 RepID=UPI001EDA643A|nr:hypothetical protein [Sandaracinobacteroides sayramensis]MCG2842174.1 hypothetical protein [Sandaracinobacteroides sayramensis]